MRPRGGTVRAMTAPADAEEMTPAQIGAVAVSHIKRFSRMIARGGHGIRVDECRMYLAIWQDIYQAVLMGLENASQLRPAELCELEDALYCGDYDDLIEAASAPGFVGESLTVEEMGL
jgi:hypothetical protein